MSETGKLTTLTGMQMPTELTLKPREHANWFSSGEAML